MAKRQWAAARGTVGRLGAGCAVARQGVAVLVGDGLRRGAVEAVGRLRPETIRHADGILIAGRRRRRWP